MSDFLHTGRTSRIKTLKQHKTADSLIGFVKKNHKLSTALFYHNFHTRSEFKLSLNCGQKGDWKSKFRQNYLFLTD